MTLSAQTNETPAAVKTEGAKAEKKSPPKQAGAKKAGEAKSRTLPFHGKLSAVDKMAKSISVGERTFQITSTTKIFKADKPALLEEGVVGELVTGSYKTNQDGKLAANSVYFGGKSAGKTAKAAEKAEAKKPETTAPQTK